MNKRHQNYIFCVSILSLLGLILNDFGMLPASFNQYVEVIMYFVIGTGIAINPSLGKGVKDVVNKTEE